MSPYLRKPGMEARDFSRVRLHREEFLDEFFSKLSAEEKQTLSDLLDKLLNK